MRFYLLHILLWLLIGGFAFAEPTSSANGTVSLTTVLTTGSQQGMQQTRTVFSNNQNSDDAATNLILRQLLASPPGPSNAFLVEAANSKAAIAITSNVLGSPRSVDEPVPTDRANSAPGMYWLVVYLGAGPSMPSRWNVKQIAVSRDAIRFNFQSASPSPTTSDVRPYYYWAPIGQLRPGTYRLELFDVGRGMIRMMRTVDVPPIPQKGEAQ